MINNIGHQYVVLDNIAAQPGRLLDPDGVVDVVVIHLGLEIAHNEPLLHLNVVVAPDEIPKIIEVLQNTQHRNNP